MFYVDNKTSIITTDNQDDLYLGVVHDDEAHLRQFKTARMTETGWDKTTGTIIVTAVTANGQVCPHYIPAKQIHTEGDDIIIDWIPYGAVYEMAGDVSVNICSIMNGPDDSGNDQKKWGSAQQIQCKILEHVDGESFVPSEAIDDAVASALQQIQQAGSNYATKEDLNDLRSEFESGSVGGGSGIPQAQKTNFANAIRNEIAYVSTSHPFTDAFLSWLEDSGSDTPVTPPEDEPTAPTLTGITVTWSAESANVGINPSTLISSVKATYSDGTSKNVTGYTVNPSALTKGSNTVTVTYQGKTATKVITGISVPVGDNAIYSWDLTKSLVDSKEGKVISLFGATQDTSGLHLNNGNAYALIDNGLLDVLGKRVEIEFGECSDGGFSTHGRLIRLGTSAGTTSFDHALCWRSTGYWAVYAGSWKTVTNEVRNKNAISNSKAIIEFVGTRAQANLTVKIGDIVVHDSIDVSSYSFLAIGASNQSYYNATIKSIKVYEV